MKITVHLVKAFTEDPNQGNPAGVALETRSIKVTRKQAIAAELGFSESSFVEESTVADYRVRFFSVQQEVDFCGHATVATFFTLMSAGHIKPSISSPVTLTQETGIGILPVTCFSDGKVMMGQNDPIFGIKIADRREVTDLLSLSENDLLDQPIQVVSTGVNKLIVPVKSLAALRAINPKLDEIVQHGKSNNYSGIAIISPEPFTSNGDISTRNFSPSVGIDEDPATGIAAGPLACYAQKYLLLTQSNFVIEQGFDMGKASTIYVELGDKVKVGGYAVNFGEREFSL